MNAPAAPRSKTLATWLALVGGSLGLHRFYLNGGRDPWAWLYPLPTAVGALGFWRMRHLGVDDAPGNLLVPLLGAAVSIAMLEALVIGLTPAERWNARHGSGGATGWITVLGVISALAIGAGTTVATIAFVAQRYFESNVPL